MGAGGGRAQRGGGAEALPQRAVRRVPDVDGAAFADGELSGERETEVAAAVTGDAELAQQVQRHRALKAMLAEH